MKRLQLLLLMFLAFTPMREVFSQSTDLDYERIKVGEAKNILSGLALAPDNQTLAISSIQSFPLYLFDWQNEKQLDKFNVGNWYGGSAIEYSKNGKYLLLNQLYYIDFALNKDREVNFEVVDATTGKRVKRFENYHSVKITSDEKYAIALSGDEVSFWNLATGNKEKSFIVPDAGNSIAISPDGKFIAVSHRLYEKDAKEIPQLQRDKKTLKNALKYKRQISVFDAVTFKKLYTVNELYDIVYKLKFNEKGTLLFCLNIPHTKIQNVGTERQMYVNVIDMEDHTPRRRGFVSKANYEPDFKLSHDGKLFGIISRSNRFLELHIYDFEAGRMLYRFQESYRLFEKNDGEMIAVDSRASFVFLPGDETALITMGNHLIKWNFKPKNK